MMDTLSTDSEKLPVKVGVIGCGWLGKALVKSLVEKKYDVIATTQNIEKLPLIKELGARAEILSLPFNGINQNSAAVFGCEILVICIPPGIRKGKKDYPEKIADIIKQAESGKVQKVILISTTAVYEGMIGDVTESSNLKFNNEKVKLLTEAEQSVINYSKQGIVMRCAGLVGPGRHPGIFFKNKKLLTAPNTYVNLIHQKDVVEQILLIIKSDAIKGVFNAVSETHVTKKYYYTVAANAFNADLPRFDTQNEVEKSGRKVLSNKLRNVLNYQYQYDDLVAWLVNHQRAS